MKRGNLEISTQHFTFENYTYEKITQKHSLRIGFLNKYQNVAQTLVFY